MTERVPVAMPEWIRTLGGDDNTTAARPGVGIYDLSAPAEVAASQRLVKG